jgi:hypothetical protein
MLRNREGDVAKDIPIAPRTGRVTFEEAATDLLNDYKSNHRRSTEGVERNIDLHLRPVFGHFRLAAIPTADIRAFTVERQKAGAGERIDQPRTRHHQADVSRSRLRLEHDAPQAHRADAESGQRAPRLLRGGAVPRRPGTPAGSPTTCRHLRLPYGWPVRSEGLPLELRNVNLTTCEVRLDATTTKSGESRELPYGTRSSSTCSRLAGRDEASRATGGADRAVGVPPRRETDSQLSSRVEGCVQGGWLSRPNPA